jgi:hypothetical protein
MASSTQAAQKAARATIQRFRHRVFNNHRVQEQLGMSPMPKAPSPVLAITDASGRADPLPYGTPGAALVRNPFVPYKPPGDGKRWIGPKYSMRRQKELIKAAKATGLVDLLPPGPKLRDPLALANMMAVLSLQQQQKDLHATEKQKRRRTREAAAADGASVAAPVDASRGAAKVHTPSGVKGSSSASPSSTSLGLVAVEETANSDAHIAIPNPPPAPRENTAWHRPLRWQGAPRKLKPTQVLGVRLRMYFGRRGKAFKGTAWQRASKARMAERRKQMGRMARRVKIYQTVRTSSLLLNVMLTSSLHSTTAAAVPTRSSRTPPSSSPSCRSDAWPPRPRLYIVQREEFIIFHIIIPD